MTSRKIPESAVENLVSDLEGKANVANTVTTNTNQTITSSKNLKTGGTNGYSRPFQIFMPTSTESNPTEDKTREIAFLSSDGTGNNYEGSLTHSRFTDGTSYTGLRTGRLVNGTYTEASIGAKVAADGTTFGTAPTTPDNAPANALVTKDKIANMVTTNTAQTISGVKTFTGGTLKANTPLLLKQDNADEGGQIDFELSNNSVLKNNPSIDLFVNTIRFVGVNSNNTVNITLQVDLQNKRVYAPTPAINANDTQVATTAWFNSKMQVVSALPAAPDANVFYFIPG